MIVDVRIRFELTPTDNGYQTSSHEQREDLRDYLRGKARDVTLQSNSTRLKIQSFATHVVMK